MAMPEMQKAITKIRFVLATIKDKEQQLALQRRQFIRQLNTARGHALRGSNSLDATLGIMGEIQERLDSVERTQEHLVSIKKRAQEELQALDLTDRIEQAKTEVTSLKSQSNLNGEIDSNHQGKIKELERFIQEASVRAGQAITGELDIEDLSGRS